MPGRKFRYESASPRAPVRSSFASSKWPSISMGSRGSSSFWGAPPKPPKEKWRMPRAPRFGGVGHVLSRRRITLLILFAFVLLFTLTTRGHYTPETTSVLNVRPIRATLPASAKKGPDPILWLHQNSGDKHSVLQTSSGWEGFGMKADRRPRAALISLVRDNELEGIMASMRQLESRWNRKYQYPWIFFNDQPFTEEFKAATRNLTSAPCHYQIIPKEHWSMPEWIDENRLINSLEYLGTTGAGKEWLIRYHHMHRWNSGFFYKHPFLKDYDWYWRVEPDALYFCDINYDVFRFMRDNNMKYGFNMNILDDAPSFPYLWTHTRKFVKDHPELLHPQSDLNWLINPEDGAQYNYCQFFSNFEIGSLNFWRGKANEAYFEALDEAGGFYYERLGDAPVHTLSVSMFVPKSEIWFFRDIGYQHDINAHCPQHVEGTCQCELTRLDENFYSLVPPESPQKKPKDTCIRGFLGGEWLEKKEGWSAEGEKALGGDGYHGYIIF